MGDNDDKRDGLNLMWNDNINNNNNNELHWFCSNSKNC